ncbi:hypothetical protein HG530_014269 [Fusarium avenaceum]|nr:hypothetical protein HG530_014269 [Fusarium avenaceum]
MANPNRPIQKAMLRAVEHHDKCHRKLMPAFVLDDEAYTEDCFDLDDFANKGPVLARFVNVATSGTVIVQTEVVVPGEIVESWESCVVAYAGRLDVERFLAPPEPVLEIGFVKAFGDESINNVLLLDEMQELSHIVEGFERRFFSQITSTIAERFFELLYLDASPVAEIALTNSCEIVDGDLCILVNVLGGMNRHLLGIGVPSVQDVWHTRVVHARRVQEDSACGNLLTQAKCVRLSDTDFLLEISRLQRSEDTAFVLGALSRMLRDFEQRSLGEDTGALGDLCGSDETFAFAGDVFHDIERACVGHGEGDARLSLG